LSDVGRHFWFRFWFRFKLMFFFFFDGDAVVGEDSLWALGCAPEIWRSTRVEKNEEPKNEG
jgi:hypothetical protein